MQVKLKGACVCVLPVLCCVVFVFVYVMVCWCGGVIRRSKEGGWCRQVEICACACVYCMCACVWNVRVNYL